MGASQQTNRRVDRTRSKDASERDLVVQEGCTVVETGLNNRSKELDYALPNDDS
jgi:hypothetical protein